MSASKPSRTADRPLSGGRTAIYRHPWLVRLTHWVNAACILVLLLSGLQILNAHPAFYWGEVSTFASPIAEITSEMDESGAMRGWLKAGDFKVETTGVLGVSGGGDWGPQARAFPAWLTLPSAYDLGAARRWHFFFAWVFALSGLAYVAHGLLSGRIGRMLAPSLADLRGLGRNLLDHARLRFAHGEEARSYNGVQKLAYLAVLFGLMPLMVFTGLAMSPAVDARFHILSELFGGRQSARTVHFLAASGLVAFFAVHIAMVIAAGPVNELRAMLTGWFVIRTDKSMGEKTDG